MTARPTGRLLQARRRDFVGRSPKQKLSPYALTGFHAPFQLPYRYGPGGLIKTTLLRVIARAGAQGPYPNLDARNLEPIAATIVAALESSLAAKSFCLSVSHNRIPWTSRDRCMKEA